MNNFEKFTLGAISVLFVIVIFFGIVLFRQQEYISAISPNAVSNTLLSSKKKNPPKVLQIFPATIESISGNKITVDIKLPDYSKPQNPGGGSVSFIDKKITVNTNSKTVFNKRALADLKEGDAISVSSYDPWQTADAVAAENVAYVAQFSSSQNAPK
ncbi:MAG: hypothetical protein WC831_03460 [Parcubacteria group bacterium]|jgi:hypothetical protein